MELAVETHALVKVYGGRRSSGRDRQPAAETLDDATAQVTGQATVTDEQGVAAVRGVDLRISAGEIYALLGPNGAGKTSTISMLTTLLLPTSGSARVAGFDVVVQASEVRRRIGVTFQEVILDQDLTGRQILDFHGSLYGMSRSEKAARIDELASLVELSDVLDRKSARYSGGMKRRLELARGLMTSPSVLFLDEPTQGLDPQNRAGIWRYIQGLRASTGMTILLTTHYMEEAESLADRVGIMDGGLLVTEGTPAALIREMGSDVVDFVGEGDSARLDAALGALDWVQHVHCLPTEDHTQRMQVAVDQAERRLADIVQTANDNGFRIVEISVARPSLAEVFLAHTGHSLRDSIG